MSRLYQVIFDDDYICAIDKPPKMLVVPSPEKKVCLTSLLTKELGYPVYPCHRLDYETSGIVLFAKSKDAQRQLMEQFKSRKVFKRYIAFVHGSVKRTFDMRAPVKAIGKEEKDAVTKFRAEEISHLFSVVNAIPITGRSNQIRIHCVQAGHPIIGDRKYSVVKDFPVQFSRTCLHATHLEFYHPFSGEHVDLRCPLPADMQQLLVDLRARVS
jgi:RluA family pseudouridine synthase